MGIFVPYVGVKAGAIHLDDFAEFLEKHGLSPMKYFSIKVKTKHGEVEFLVADVTGSTKGIALKLSLEYGVEALESGPHLRWGDPDAGVWEDVAKIVFPDGEEELVPIYLNDTFLGLRLASEKVSGLDSTIYIGGIRFKLPLTLDDLAIIVNIDRERKVERAMAIYGADRVLSKDVKEKLEEIKRKLKGEGREEK